MKKLNLLLCALLISGCSWFGGDDEDEIKPAELVKFDQQVKIKKQWSIKVGGGNKQFWNSLRPAANSDTVFAADHEGKISAFNVATGKRRWSTELDVSLSGGVGYAAGQVLVGSVEGEVYVLDAADGSMLWSAKVSSEILASPQSNGTVVAVQTIDNKLFAFDASSGEALWQHEDDAPLLTVRGTSTALVTNRMILAGFDSGKLIAFNPENGSLIWESRLALPKGRTDLERMVDVDGAALLVDDVIYAVTYQGRLGAISRGTGRSLWFQDGSSHSSPAYSSGQVYVSEADSTVRAFNSGSGQVLWSNEQLFLRRVTGPAQLGGYMAVADAEGYLHLLSPDDGSFVGRTKVDGSGVSAAMISMGDSLIIQSNGGALSSYKIQ
ncbi:outer membrane protein assembly factor BamB [Porticoccaceae bacterium]|nr:outer membrane protein assembly factor BamB [Porticoccaceae bacterium]